MCVCVDSLALKQAAILGLATNQWVTKHELVQKCVEFADLEQKRLSVIKPLTKQRCVPLAYAKQAADFVSFFFDREAMFYTEAWSSPTQSLGVFLVEALLPAPDEEEHHRQASPPLRASIVTIRAV